MANRDRYPLEPVLETHTARSVHEPQGELFARLALRQLPIMKYGPEDLLDLPTPPTIH